MVGLGTDSGGSLRVPAAFCGIYGHKHSAGLVHMSADDGSWPASDTEAKRALRAYGPLCRYVQDLWPVQSLLFDRTQQTKLLVDSPEKVC